MWRVVAVAVTLRPTFHSVATTARSVVKASVFEEVEAAVAGLGGGVGLRHAMVDTVANVRCWVEIGGAGVRNGGSVVRCGAEAALSCHGGGGRVPPPGQPSVFLLRLAVGQFVSLKVTFQGEALVADVTLVVFCATVDQRVVGQTVL